MSIHVEWDNNHKTIIRWDFDGYWDWEMVIKATKESIDLRQNRGHDELVSVILNIPSGAAIKNGVFNMTRRAFLFDPSERDVVVVVGTNPYIQAIVELFQQRYPDIADNFLLERSLHDARRLIEMRQFDPNTKGSNV